MRARPASTLFTALLSACALCCGAGNRSLEANAAENAEAEQNAEVDAEAGEEEEEDGAEEPSEPPFAEHARQNLRAGEPPSSPLGLGLVVGQRGADLPWLVVVANRADATATVAADLRLLRLEIQEPEPTEGTPGKTQPGKGQPPKPHVCELPDADRPSAPDAELVVELEPGFLLAHQFDPRLICEPEWLVPGAVVTPKFGWAPQTRTVWRQGKRVEEPVEQTAPYVAEANQQEGDPLAPVKELVGEPFTLDASYAPAEVSTPEDPDALPPLELRVKSLGTVTNPRASTITVEIKNPARKGRHLFFRRELITYEVIGPHATTSCNVYPDDRAPERQSFDFIGAGGSMRVASRLAEMCPPNAFGPPGLYRVHARLDANEAGTQHGLDAFVGVVTSKEPAIVRIRGGKPTPMWLLSIRPPNEPSE